MIYGTNHVINISIMNYKLNTHLYDSLFDVFGNAPKNYITMKESGDVYVAEAELAGFSKDDITITATNEVLEVKAKNDSREKELKLNLYGAVSVDHIKSTTKDGLLTITLPKKCVSERRKISVD